MIYKQTGDRSRLKHIVPISTLVVGQTREATFLSVHPMIALSKFGSSEGFKTSGFMTDVLYATRDRRSLRVSPHPAGTLVGHTEGLTYVAPKGDGRYIISNGKDQTLKLWDLRKMVSFKDWKDIRNDDYGIQSFDYRYVLLVGLH